MTMPRNRTTLSLAACLAVLLVGACNKYSMVESSRQTIGDAYSVEPVIGWSEESAGTAELWTVDGPELDAVRLYAALGRGDALFTTKSDADMPGYDPDMQAPDIADLVVDSIARLGAGEVDATNLRPARFGALDGFRFEVSFYTDDGLRVAGMALGAKGADGKLHLILFTGAELYYFPKYRDQVERIFQSVQTT